MKKTFAIDGEWFHGGHADDVKNVVAGKINVDRGGGELGKGFYVGNYGHMASAWAKHKYRTKAVVGSLVIEKFAQTALKKTELSWLLAKEIHLELRRKATQRSFVFATDVVAAPIVGAKVEPDVNQLKWESRKAETYLNSTAIVRSITKL